VSSAAGGSLRNDVPHRDLALSLDDLRVRATVVDQTLLSEDLELVSRNVGESPVLAVDDDLASWELHTRTAQSLVGALNVLLLGADGD
jgi:hypothetical protein